MDTLRITTDPAALDVALIHRFLSEQSTWARGIPLATVQRALAHSLCFGGFVDGAQVAFARVISDRATFANLVDVFVLPAFRGRGYSKQLVQAATPTSRACAASPWPPATPMACTRALASPRRCAPSR